MHLNFSDYYKGTYIPMFMAVFARVRMWKQPKCPSVDVIVNTHTHTPAHTQNGILLNHKKKNGRRSKVVKTM